MLKIKNILKGSFRCCRGLMGVPLIFSALLLKEMLSPAFVQRRNILMTERTPVCEVNRLGCLTFPSSLMFIEGVLMICFLTCLAALVRLFISAFLYQVTVKGGYFYNLTTACTIGEH